MHRKMITMEQFLWIVLLANIDFFLPQVCPAAVESKDEWMGNDEAKFAMKPTRKLLLDDFDKFNKDWDRRKEEIDRKFDNFQVVPIIIGTIMGIIMLIVTVIVIVNCCCMQNNGINNEVPSGLTLHPPPGASRPSARTISRTLAPPMSTSHSLILIPEDGSRAVHTLILGIENPNYIQPSINDSNQDWNSNPVLSLDPPVEVEMSSNPTLSDDLPPDYDSVVKADWKEINKIEEV